MHFITRRLSSSKQYKKSVLIATICLVFFTCLPAYATYHLYFINNTSSAINYASKLNTVDTACSNNISSSDSIKLTLGLSSHTLV